MQNGVLKIDLLKLLRYILKRIWLVILCAAIGFAGMYYYVAKVQTDTYSASATLYVYNGNPNVVNYQYVSSNDLSTAVQLLDTYMVVVKSNKVMDSVAERLSAQYPGITNSFIAGTLSMGSVSDTGVLRVVSTTTDPQLAADICNAVLDAAPSEIIRVVGAGSVEVIDYAEVPTAPVSRGPMKKGLLGGMAGAVLAAGILVLFFLLNRRVGDSREIESNYTPPIFASIKRMRRESKDPTVYLLNENLPRDTFESYAKLRMNLLYSLAEKESNAVAVTSSISGEGKSTIAANLAVSCAMSCEKVILIDADMRRGCQAEIFTYSSDAPGLSEVLRKRKSWQECVIHTKYAGLDVLPAGKLPSNPAELMSSMQMKELLKVLGEEYQLVLIDVPPINIVSDPLMLSDIVAGCLFVVRQNYSDHREIRRALIAAEMTKMEVMGFVFYGEKTEQGYYYAKKYYKSYYNRYTSRVEAENTRKDGETGHEEAK